MNETVLRKGNLRNRVEEHKTSPLFDREIGHKIGAGVTVLGQLSRLSSEWGRIVPLVEVDRRILDRCLRREPGAWEEFVDRFISVFMHVIRHTAYTRSVDLSSADIEDLCSEIYLTLLMNDFVVLRHFKGKSSLATYLAVVARRVVVKSLIQRKKLEALGHTTTHAGALKAAGSDAAQPVVDQEEVRALMASLPPNEAAIVKAFYLDGHSYQQISTELNIPENSIGPTLHRAKERLRSGKVNA